MNKGIRNLKFVLLLVLVAITLTGCFSKWTISGVVKDEDTGNPLTGVSLTVEHKKTASVDVDDQGKWQVDVSGDEAVIKAVKDGYVFKPKTVTKNDQDKTIEILGTAQLTIAPDSGTYGKRVTVSLGMGGDYTIYYTLDGSDPTEDSDKYTDKFTISEIGTTTVKAIAVSNTDPADKTEVLEATYEIVEPTTESLVINGDFEDGVVDPWKGANAEVSITDKEAYEGDYSLFVSNRTETGPGALQLIHGWEPGATYKLSGVVKYVDGPSERGFGLALFGEGYSEVYEGWDPVFATTPARVNAIKGEWNKLEAEFTLPEGATVDKLCIIFETTWVPEVDPENDLMDFYLDNVSIVKID